VKETILLTGATGLLGRYLLRDLLRAGRRVAVLVRPAGGASANERIEALRASWGETLPQAEILDGELAPDGIALTAVDRRWLARNVGAVLHAAADTSFRAGRDGEPWRTNVGGTQALLRLARQLDIPAWHHVSTAFVCGCRRGRIEPDDLDCGQDFNNAYEHSKCAAEAAVRAAAGLQATVYRPAVIVGDSETGFTSSYAGLYRFLELGARLARADADRFLPMRLPLCGDAPCNLVPVDWVARAIVAMLDRPATHGRTYHLVARVPTLVRAVHDVAAAELGVRGVELVGPGPVVQPSRLEETFREALADYWPYLEGCAEFCDRATTAALPDLPPPVLDGARLRRLVHFARADRWGRRTPAPDATPACASYFEETFPRQAGASALARAVGLDVVAAFDVRGPGGGQWSCRWTGGEFTGVRCGLDTGAAAVYRTDVATFWAIVRREVSPQHAFFQQRVTVTGDLETALKLATLFEYFLDEQGLADDQSTEATRVLHPR
jgi:thioester reductase-like protein